MNGFDPKPFLKFSNEQWQNWISAAVSRTPLSPHLALGRDVELHHAIRALYLALPTDESRRAMLQGLSWALASAPVLPTDERTAMGFFYLLHLVALLKPPESRVYTRSLLKAEVFSDILVAQTNLHCLLVAVCAKYGVDVQLTRDLLSGTDRISSSDYLLSCFRALSLGCESGAEACMFLDYLVPQLSSDSLALKLQSNLELCARLHGLAAIDSWYQFNEPTLAINSIKELAILEGCLTRLIYSTSARNLEAGMSMQKRIFEKYGPESLFNLVKSKATDAAGCVRLLVSLHRAGLNWSWIDIGSLRSHRKMFREAGTSLCIGSEQHPLDPFDFPVEYSILAGAADSVGSTSGNVFGAMTRDTRQLSVSLCPDLLVM